ncbi:MAG: RNA polymerase subunit sigma-24, partial [Myxococcota bacterium]
VHARAERSEDTDWKRIARLYERLLVARPTPVVALNHAVASAMAFGPEEGLRLTEVLRDDLEDYGPFQAARADFLRTTSRWGEAARAYERAIALATNDPERRFLERRLAEVRANDTTE